MKREISFLISFLFFANLAFAQNKPNPALTADSLATGNYKDVLTSFFQLAFNRFIGDDKEIRFASNPFAVMAKADTSLLMDAKYYKYRHLRDLNFSFAAKLDSSYKFNGFSSGIKYAIINKRDETVSRAFLVSVADNFKTQELFTLNNDLEAYIAELSSDPVAQEKVRNQKTAFTRGEINFNQLDIALQEKIIQLVKARNSVHLSSLLESDPNYNVKKASQEIYNNFKKIYNNKLLWTVGITDTTYKDHFFFSNVVLSSELVKGMGDTSKRNNFEINILTALQYVDDSLKAGRDLKRTVFSFEPALNIVLKGRETNKSFFEFELGGTYYHTFTSLYEGEERDRLTLNATLRVRILNDIWIPLDIKYEPKTGNVFGFLNVRANFNGLRKILQQ